MRASDSVPVETWYDGLIKFDDKLQIEDKITNISVSGNGIKYGWIDGSVFHGGSEYGRYGITKSDNGYFNGNEEITVTYESIGNYNGRSIGMNVVMNVGKGVRPAWWESSEGSVILLGFNNIEDNQLYGKSSFVRGITLLSVGGTNIRYQLVYTDTKQPLYLNECYWSWGSLNPSEGISSANPSTKYFRNDGAYPKVTNVNDGNYLTVIKSNLENGGAYNYPYGWSGTNYVWAIGDEGEFTDVMGSSDFYKSAISMLVTSNDSWYRFRVMGANIWFTPMLAPMGSTAPDPTSYLIEDSKAVNTAKHMVDENVTMVTSQKTMRMSVGGTGMKKYVSMTLYLTVPSQIDYKSAYVQDQYGNRVSSGTLNYNSQTREVSFAITKDFLQKNMVYDGREYQLIVNGTVNSTFKNVTSVSTSARTEVNSSFRSANQNTVTPKYFTISTSVTNGTITGSYTARSNSNSTVSYAPTNTTDYVLNSVNVDGTNVSTSTYPSSYSFNNITSDHSIAVSYRRVYKVITSKEGSGTVTDSIYKIEKGTNRLITYKPSNGYYVKSVTIDGNSVNLLNNSSSVTISNIQKDYEVKVVFAKKPKITISVDTTGSNTIWSKGSPMSLIKVKGKDYLGRNQVFYRVIGFSNNGQTLKSITMSIPSGEYTISQMGINEYQQSKVEALTNSWVSGSSVVVDTRNTDSASIRFTNRQSDYSEYTHNDLEVNLLR